MLLLMIHNTVIGVGGGRKKDRFNDTPCSKVNDLSKVTVV